MALLGKSFVSARVMIDRLFSGLRIDRGTRVIVVNFTTYNPNINLFGVCKCGRSSVKYLVLCAYTHRVGEPYAHSMPTMVLEFPSTGLDEHPACETDPLGVAV